MSCSFRVKYEVLYTIGKGNFGKVYLAESRKDGKQFAVKVIDKKTSSEHQLREQLICETFMKTLRHKNIVQVYDVIVEEDVIYIVMDYIQGGELFDKIKQSKSLSEHTARRWFREIIEAVEYIHKNNIVHRDLKPENVLIDKTQQVRICDFGFGNIIQGQHQVLNTYCGSPFYAAPEMVTATPYEGPPVDLWSCGVILYAMLTGSLPFRSNEMPQLFQKISQGQYFIPPYISDEASNLIRRLLCKDPQRRITASECLSHDWFLVPDSYLAAVNKSLSTLRKSDVLKEEEEVAEAIPEDTTEKRKSILSMLVFKKKSQVAPLLGTSEKNVVVKADLLNQIRGFFKSLLSKETRLKKSSFKKGSLSIT